MQPFRHFAQLGLPFFHIPAVVAGKGGGIIRNKSTLVGADPFRILHQAVKGIPFDVQLGVGIAAQKLGNAVHIVRPDMALVGPGMERDAVRPRIQRNARSLRHIGNADSPRVPKRGNLVQVHTQFCHGRSAVGILSEELESTYPFSPFPSSLRTLP